MGKCKRFLCCCLICAVIICVLLPLTSVGNALADGKSGYWEPQWFLTDRHVGEIGYGSDSQSLQLYEMVRGDSSLPEGSVGLEPGQSIIWRADYSTPAQAPFGSKEWHAKIMLLQAPCEGDMFHIYLGYLLANDSEGLEFTPMGSAGLQKKTGRDRLWWFEVRIAPDEFTVPAGGWLALKIVNETCLNRLEVRTGQSCGWIKPPHNPCYPVPELDGIVLFTVGLVCLAGYVVLRRNVRLSGRGLHHQ